MQDFENYYLPKDPSDGQIFVAQDGTKLQYDLDSNRWNFVRTNANVDLADDTRVGLLDPKYKIILDSVSSYPGAFGLILNKPTNRIMQGDVKLHSTSLDIECVETIDSTYDGRKVEDVGSIVNFVFKLKEDYLNNICIDPKPPKGRRGRTGQTGPDGPHGFGSGPIGYDGEIGPNATKLMRIRNVIYEDINELSDKAIVDIELIDRGKGPFFKITESDRTLSDNEPAQRLIVNQLSRGLRFRDKVVDGNCKTDFVNSWEITRDTDDGLPIDVHMLRLSDDETEAAQTFSSLRLSEYIRSVVEDYQNKIIELDKEWSKRSKEHIEEIDKAAREILNNLANELTRCESTIAATEFGIPFERCRISSPNSLSTFKTASNKKISSINNSGKNWEVVV
jgi:transcription termination factor NusB